MLKWVQNLFQKVRTWKLFFRKRAKKRKKGQKRAKYFKIWAKIYKIWKCFEKQQVCTIFTHNKWPEQVMGPIKSVRILIFTVLYFFKFFFSHAYQKSWYDIQFLRYRAWYFGHFLPFCPPKNPKNQNSKKMKKIAGDIIILHLCTKNHIHMM